jgi:molybdopterin-guanine dinucleotide biosynthesis protein A
VAAPLARFDTCGAAGCVSAEAAADDVTTLALVLAGGDGRRMGGAKPLRSFGSTTLIANAVRLAAAYARDVVVAVRDPGQVGPLEARLVIDEPGLPGPIAGLYAGLEHAEAVGADRLLCLPCDTPDLPEDLARRLHAALDGDPRAGAAMASSAGRLHPACCLWRVEALSALAGYLAAGRSSLRGFADICGGVVAAWPATDRDPFANINTPQDLARLRLRVDAR